MNKAIGAATLLFLGLVQPAIAAAAPPGPERRVECPDRAAREADKAYDARALNDCEVRWTRLVDARQTGGETQDEFVNTCAKRCGVKRDRLSGSTLALIVLGLGAAGGAAAAAGGGKGGASDPPPVDPPPASP